MSRVVIRSLSLLAATLAVSGAAFADFGAVANLSGANENPANASPAFGQAILHYNSVAQTLDYSVTFSNLTAGLSAGHIHAGLPGVNGPVILGFNVPAGLTSGSFSGTLTAANLIARPAVGINTFADAIGRIEAGGTYVNLHNSAFPGGEIRGQGIAAPEPGAALLIAGALPLFGLALRRRAR